MKDTSQIIQRNKVGFTLIEMILSVTMIGIMTAIIVPIYYSFQVRNDLDIAAVTAAQSFRRAALLSQAVDGDASWGAKIQAGNITVFKGISYVGRDIAYDEVSNLPTSITPSGLSEIVFTKFSGLPGSTGTVTLTSNANETRTITINPKGMVNY